MAESNWAFFVVRLSYDYALESWQDPKLPVTGPAFDWSPVTLEVMHYRGSGKNPVPKDIAAYLRASHREYVTSRGYSLGYNAAVVSDPDHPMNGTLWEIRGDRYRCAANAGVNHKAFAILVVQADNAPMTPEAESAVRRLGRELNQRAGRRLHILSHGDTYGPPHGGTTATACAGIGVQASIDAGRLAPLEVPGLARAARFIVKGYQNQLKVESIANPEHLIQTGLDKAPLVEISLTAADRKIVEELLGIRLTPR